MAFFLQTLSPQFCLEIVQKPENVIFPILNYGILNSASSINQMPLNLNVPRPIWRPFEVTFSKFDIKFSKSGEAPVKKKNRKRLLLPSHISVGKDEKSTKELYNCSVCSKTFKTKAHVKYHKFCSGEKKPFKCGDCQMEFITKSHFEYHLRTHTGERPYACSICQKRFNQRGKVTRHMRMHTGEKPYICGCGRGFSNAQALKTHNMVHTGERPYPCLEPGCRKRFSGLTNLKKHKITHTGDRRYAKSSDRPYGCKVCERAFSYKKDLLRHSIIHTDKRPYECGFCDMAFRRKDNLVRHIRNLHPEQFGSIMQTDEEGQNEALSTVSNFEAGGEGKEKSAPFVGRPAKENCSLKKKVSSEKNPRPAEVGSTTATTESGDIAPCH